MESNSNRKCGSIGVTFAVTYDPFYHVFSQNQVGFKMAPSIWIHEIYLGDTRSLHSGEIRGIIAVALWGTCILLWRKDNVKGGLYFIKTSSSKKLRIYSVHLE